MENGRTKYTLIDSITECIKIVEEVLLKENIIALDCEGVFLSKEGRLTLLQISLLDERVFIFDILKGGSLMFLGLDDNKRGLKAVLENKKILKLIHDCRNDWDSLLHQYSVRIYNFVDTQEAYFIFKLFYYQEITLPISLLKFIEMMTNVKLEYKQKFKTVMNEDPFMWSNRPLSEEQLIYASEDVVYLIKAWIILRDKFNENLREIIFFLTILKVVDTNCFDQFREYLIANIIYFGMLENVFLSKDVYNYIFAVDYIYNFLRIKIVSDRRREEEMNVFQNMKNNLLPDEEYYKFVKEQKTSASIIQFGLNFKEKQRILSLKHFNDEEMMMIEKINWDSKFDSNGKNNATNEEVFNNWSNINGINYQDFTAYSDYNTNYSNKEFSNYGNKTSKYSYMGANKYYSIQNKNYNCKFYKKENVNNQSGVENLNTSTNYKNKNTKSTNFVNMQLNKLNLNEDEKSNENPLMSVRDKDRVTPNNKKKKYKFFNKNYKNTNLKNKNKTARQISSSPVEEIKERTISL